jgi:hypothetical protein
MTQATVNAVAWLVAFLLLEQAIPLTVDVVLRV